MRNATSTCGSSRPCIEQGLCRFSAVDFLADLERLGSDLVTDDLQSEVHSRFLTDPVSEARMHPLLRSAMALAALMMAPLAGHFPALTTDLSAQTQAIDP